MWYFLERLKSEIESQSMALLDRRTDEIEL
jgi:hypothetical protein